MLKPLLVELVIWVLYDKNDDNHHDDYVDDNNDDDDEIVPFLQDTGGSTDARIINGIHVAFVDEEKRDVLIGGDGFVSSLCFRR